MRGILLALLLIAAGISGCIGDGGSTIGTSQTDNVNRGCSSTSTDGTVRPGEPLAVAGEAGADGASAQMAMDAGGAGAGSIHITLAHDGETVWSDEIGTQGVTLTNWANTAHNLPAGNYTLTATVEDGVFDVQELRLEITWGGGTCT